MKMKRKNLNPATWFDDFVPEDETDAEETEDTDENKPAKKSKGCAITVF